MLRNFKPALVLLLFILLAPQGAWAKAAPLSLNGDWNFLTDPQGKLAVSDLSNAANVRPTRVPSSWQQQFTDLRDYAGVAWYWRVATLDALSSQQVALLRFGAVDYRADVYVNGQKAGSHDGYKSAVAERALDTGAVIVNDISGLHFDSGLADVVGRYHASIILMHIQGTPKTMQEQPEYENLIEDICAYLQEGIHLAESKGIEQIIVDPGIGFGKTVTHNLEIIRRLREFNRFGHPVLVGPSRKSFIGKILDVPIDQRVEGTAAAVALSIANGASIVRVHDVKQMKQVAQMTDAILHSSSDGLSTTQ